MKVHYELKMPIEVDEIKKMLKPFGGRCAKVNENKLEYQIKVENEQEAFNQLKAQGIIE